MKKFKSDPELHEWVKFSFKLEQQASYKDEIDIICSHGYLRVLRRIWVPEHKWEEINFNLVHLAAKELRLDIINYLIEEKNFDIHQFPWNYLIEEKKFDIHQFPWNSLPLPYIHWDTYNYWPGLYKYHTPKIMENIHYLRQQDTSLSDIFFDDKDIYEQVEIAYTRKLHGLLVHLLFQEDFVDVNRIFDYCITSCPLWIALQYSPDLVTSLIKRGADINLVDDRGNTLLHRASCTGDIKLVLALLDLGANVNAENQSESTPIHKCLQKKPLIGVIKALIERGANLNVRELSGYSHLDYAVKSCSLEVVQLLIENGADVNFENPLTEGTSIFLLGIYYIFANSWSQAEAKDIIKHLKDKGANVNHKNINGGTPLHMACQKCSQDEKGSVNIIEGLVENGADVNAEDDHGQTPLMVLLKNIAEKSKFSNVFRKALDCMILNGAEFEQNPKTFAHILIRNLVIFVVIDFLMDRKRFDINKRDEKGQTLLWLIITSDVPHIRKTAIVDQLLRRGAKTDITKNEGIKLMSLIKVKQ